MSIPARYRNQWLNTPERNNFFYGKLMDVAQFERETAYFKEMRCLINRLVLGSGVVRGLDVDLCPGDPGLVCIKPGIAIDGWGREIIVPSPQTVNHSRLTDDDGKIESGNNNNQENYPVVICLAYAEKKTELKPVLVPDCETKSNCACNIIEEGYVVLVRKYVNEGHRLDSNLRELKSRGREDLHEFLCRHLLREPAKVPGNGCVPLAKVTKGGEDEEKIKVEPYIRPLVYNNTLLLQLILDLADRVKKLEPPEE